MSIMLTAPTELITVVLEPDTTNFETLALSSSHNKELALVDIPATAGKIFIKWVQRDSAMRQLFLRHFHCHLPIIKSWHLNRTKM